MDKKPFELKVDKTALVIVDLQNDFVRVGAPMEVPDARETIGPVKRLIAFARQNNMPVIYTKFISGPKYTLVWEWSPKIKEDKSCWRGVSRTYGDASQPLDCTDIVDEIYPEKQDYIVEKYGYSAFHNTNLKDILRAEGKDTIIVVGTVTHICVEDTVHEAMHEDFKVVVAEDGVSSFAPELHNAMLKNVAMKYGRVESADQIISELKG